MPAIFLHNAIFPFAQEKQTHIIIILSLCVCVCTCMSLDKYNLQFAFQNVLDATEIYIHNKKYTELELDG